MLAEVRFPLLPEDTQFGFIEFSRPRRVISPLAASLVTYRLNGGVIADVRVGVGGAEASQRARCCSRGPRNGKKPDDSVFAAGRGCGGRCHRSAGRCPDPAGITGASWCRPWSIAPCSRPHERSDQRLRQHLGGPRDPAARGIRPWSPAGGVHHRGPPAATGGVSRAAPWPRARSSTSPCPTVRW